MSKPDRVKLWDAVNDYANACGGDTSRHVCSPARMDAVVAVERAVDDELATLRAENERWKAKYIEARQSGYAEGREEAAADLSAENERLKRELAESAHRIRQAGAGGAVVSKSEMERLARKAWPGSERLHVDVDGDRDPNPFVEVYGELLGWHKGVELACCNDRAVPAMLSALRVLAGEEDPELAALRAENEQLKAEVEKLDYANSKMCAKIVRLESIVREAQATIERLKGEQEVRS